MHLVMEHLDFARALEHGGSYIRETVEKLRSTEALSEQEAKAIRIDQIQGFLRLRPDGVPHRRALCRRNGSLSCKRMSSGTQVIVQGIIDCFSEEEDGMVIIDYKNSYVGSEAEEEELRQRYGEQLALYKEALESILGASGQGNLAVSFLFEKIYPYRRKILKIVLTLWYRSGTFRLRLALGHKEC